jgi:hypothetical protein
MASPVICVRDASIPNNVFQIVDLFPNRSQTNPVLDPVAQGPRYLSQPVNDTPVIDGVTIASEVSGLTAYLLVNQDNNNDILSVTDAGRIAGLYISRMRNGLALDLATMNGLIQGAGQGELNLGNVEIEGANSTATTAEILSILSGATYTVPAGYEFDADPGLNNPTVSFFDTTVFNAIDENDSSFYLSLSRGALSKAKSVRVDPRTGSNLDPLVVVYSGTGAVL